MLVSRAHKRPTAPHGKTLLMTVGRLKNGYSSIVSRVDASSATLTACLSTLLAATVRQAPTLHESGSAILHCAGVPGALTSRLATVLARWPVSQNPSVADPQQCA